MTCDEYQEQVSQYIDGELGDKDSGILFKHLSSCAECRSFLRSTLELRSKIHDEMLMEGKATQIGPPTSFATAFALPFVALLVTFFLFLGISQISTPYQYDTSYPQYMERGHNPIPGSQDNPF